MFLAMDYLIDLDHVISRGEDNLFFWRYLKVFDDFVAGLESEDRLVIFDLMPEYQLSYIIKKYNFVLDTCFSTSSS